MLIYDSVRLLTKQNVYLDFSSKHRFVFINQRATVPPYSGYAWILFGVVCCGVPVCVLYPGILFSRTPWRHRDDYNKRASDPNDALFSVVEGKEIK